VAFDTSATFQEDAARQGGNRVPLQHKDPAASGPAKFAGPHDPADAVDGPTESAGPSGNARSQTGRAVTGPRSDLTLEDVFEI
jgi:hypothetical protein